MISNVYLKLVRVIMKSSFCQSFQMRQINISCNEIYGIMHILVSKCNSKGLNEEEFVLLNTATENVKI